MKESTARVINLTKLFGINFTWKQVFSLLLLYPLILGILTGTTLNSLSRGIIIYILTFSLPSILLGLLAKFLFTNAKIKHVMLASSIGGFIYSTFFFIFYIITLYTGNEFLELGILISGFFSSLIWYFVGSVFFKSIKKSLVFAFIQFIFYISIISINTGYLYEEASYKYVLALIVFSLAIASTYYLISIPLKRNLGYGVIEMLQMFFAQWIFNEKDLETAFNKIAKEVILSVKGLRIGKTALIIPSFHYGPFGTLCSSNFPSFLKKETGYSALHGAATHDLNLAHSKEKGKVVKEIKSMFGNSKKYTTFSFSEGREGDEKCYVLSFGKSALILFSRAPKTTEDLEYSAGLILEERAKKYFDNVAIVDMHNSEGKDIRYFDSLSKVFNNYSKAMEKAIASLKDKKSVKLKHSYFWLKSAKNKSLGKAGISIHCFYWKKPIALVIIDGNSIDNKCRENIERIGDSLNAKVLVLTTDTHEINNIKGVVNEYKCNETEIKEIERGLSTALKTLKEEKAEFSEKEITLKVLGKDFSVETISTINSSLAIARVLIPFGIVFSLLIALYVVNVF